MQAIIHINDNNLLVQQGDKLTRHQGYAWLRGEDLIFDLGSESIAQESAVLNCRLHPQQINNRYWQQCEQLALPANQVGLRHSADLVWRHLSELRAQHLLSEVIFVVPSHYQSSNLELLAGIAAACELKVVSIINKAVLNAYHELSQGGSHSRYTHVDVQLHQTVCSEVLIDGDNLALGEVEVLHDIGLSSLQDSLLQGIQQRFISSDRFDPLHYAETEQQLFNALPDLAEQVLLDGKVNVTVTHSGQQHGVSLDRSQWLECTTQSLESIKSVGLLDDTQVPHFDFNGFTIVSDVQNTNPVLLSWANLLALLEVDSQSGLSYRTSVKAQNVNTNTTDTRLTERPRHNNDSPLYLLKDGLAYAVEGARIDVEASGLQLNKGKSNIEEMLAKKKLFVVGEPSRTQLQANDRLGSDLADGVITVISLVTE